MCICFVTSNFLTDVVGYLELVLLIKGEYGKEE